MAVAAAQAHSNPLVRAAAVVPLEAARLVSIVARVAGASSSFYYAVDQDYDRTQVVTVIVGVLVLATFIPAGRLTGWLTALGGGLLLFSGAILVHEPAGIAMLTLGAVAWLAAAAWNHHAGRDIAGTVSGLLMGALVSVAVIAVVVLAVEG